MDRGNDCALEELNAFMAQWAIPESERQWLLEWANRRAANVIEFLEAPMREIANTEPPGDGDAWVVPWKNRFFMVQAIAERALITCAIPKGGKK